MVIYIVSDMEGLCGIDQFSQCYNPLGSPEHEYGRLQLNEDVNAAIAGAFDGGAGEVRVLDGHGHNRNTGFRADLLDPRARLVKIEPGSPPRLGGLDGSVSGVFLIGQHAMAGSTSAVLAHTQFLPNDLRLYKINGKPAGEIAQCAIYAGAFGAPLIYLSGDQAACDETRSQFPWVRTTAVKSAVETGQCTLRPPDEARLAMRRDAAIAGQSLPAARVHRLPIPIQIEIEWEKEGLAAEFAAFPGVTRRDRVTRWTIHDPKDIYALPGAAWNPSRAAEAAAKRISFVAKRQRQRNASAF